MPLANLGLDELMIVNPGPVGACPCVFVPVGARLRKAPPAVAIPASPGVLRNNDGDVYRAVARIARPAYRYDPVAGAYLVT
jgi:hypothetical protein